VFFERERKEAGSRRKHLSWRYMPQLV